MITNSQNTLLGIEIKIIPNDLLNQAMSELYNGWFKKWKAIDPLDMNIGRINQCIYEMGIIVTKYEQYPVVTKIVLALWQEMDARINCGYKAVEERKYFQEGFET